MAVAKRQRREKSVKIEQRKVGGPEWRPQVKQTALLDSPIYLGQASGEKRQIHKRRKPRRIEASLLLASFGSAHPHTSRMYFPLLSKQNWAVTWSYNTSPSKEITGGYNTGLSKEITWGCNTGPSVTSNFCCNETEPSKLQTPLILLSKIVS